MWIKNNGKWTGVAPWFCTVDGDEGEDGGGAGGSGGDDGGNAGDGGDGDGAGKGDGAGGAGSDAAGGAGAGDGLMANAAKRGGGSGDGGEAGADDGAGEKVELSGQSITHNGEEIEVPKQFWDATNSRVNVGALLKAQTDTQAAFNQNASELARLKAAGNDKGAAPEKAEGYLEDPEMFVDGKLALPDTVKNMREIPTDDPVIAIMAKASHRHGLSPELFRNLTVDVLTEIDGLLPEPIDTAAELADLGDGAEAAVSTLMTWADTLLESGKLSKGEHAALIHEGRNADGIRLLGKLREMAGNKPLDFGRGGDPDNLPSKEEWYASMPDRETAPDKYAKWQKQGEDLFGTAPAGSSEQGHGMPKSRGAAQHVKR